MEMKFFNKIKEVEADIVIRLHVTPEVASNRKPEHNKEIIKLKCQNIDRVTFNKSLVIEIDATEPYEQVLLAAKREIWKHL